MCPVVLSMPWHSSRTPGAPAHQHNANVSSLHSGGQTAWLLGESPDIGHLTFLGLFSHWWVRHYNAVSTVRGVSNNKWDYLLEYDTKSFKKKKTLCFSKKYNCGYCIWYLGQSDHLAGAGLAFPEGSLNPLRHTLQRTSAKTDYIRLGAAQQWLFRLTVLFVCASSQPWE